MDKWEMISELKSILCSIEYIRWHSNSRKIQDAEEIIEDILKELLTNNK